MTNALTVLLWLTRAVGLAVGLYTMFYMYYRTPYGSLCRLNAGRISGAVTMWLSAVFISAFLVDGREALKLMSRILINVSPMLFCVIVLSIAQRETRGDNAF